MKETPIVECDRLPRVKKLWEQHELVRTELAMLLFEEREERLSKGGRGIHEGFHEWLKEAGIPKSTAYRMITEHEISIGIREEREKPVPDETSLGGGGGEPRDESEDEPEATKPTVRLPSPKSDDWHDGYATGFAEAMHKVAGARFKADPSKCYQRHIRELYAEIEPREPITSLAGATVVPIDNAEAASLIRKYEWLQTMGAGTIACYGLKINGELIGVACFGKGGSTEARNIVSGYEDQTVCLLRGCCVPWAPSNAGSYLVRRACKQAHKDYGWKIFFAYSDSDAGERGVVYQAVGWKNVGIPKAGKHVDFVKDGKTISSYQFNKKSDHIFRSMGWDGVQGKYDFLRRNGWSEVESVPKQKWVWIEGELRTPKPEPDEPEDEPLDVPVLKNVERSL